MKIYFTRHGQTIWNIEDRFQGWKDSDLTEKGIRGAELLSERMKNINIEKIYSSPIKRAYRTAEIIKGNRDLDIIKVENLKEMNFGVWEGMTKEEIKAVEEYRPHVYNIFNNPREYRTFGGESPREFAERLYKALEYIIKDSEGKDILIVTHGMCVKYIVPYFMENCTEEQFIDIPIFGQASYSEIEYNGKKFDIIELNSMNHYE